MKRLWPLVPILLLLAGCGEEKNNNTPSADLIQTATTPVSAPDFEKTSLLRLIADGKDVKVGMAVETADLAFPQPEHRAVRFRDLPPGFGPEYQSKGWETDAEGFGIIGFNNQVVAAVHTEQGVDEGRIAQIVKKYQVGLDSKFAMSFVLDHPDPSKSWARYWFAEDGQDRLMICAVRLKTGVLNVTEAIGFNQAMDALRMGHDQAKHDLERPPAKSS